MAGPTAPIDDNRVADMTAGAVKLAAVTPNDSTDLTTPARALWVGGTGNVALIAKDDSSAVTLVGVAAGTIVPVQTKRVMSTNTTATSIVALI